MGVRLHAYAEVCVAGADLDVVDGSYIATSTACILNLDLKTCTVADLDFFAEWSITLTRKDLLHALVVWFDVSFEACKPPVVLSTAPGKAHTHWKQTVLYLDEALAGHAGEELCGMAAVRKNKQNPRDLDVKISYQLNGKYGPAPRKQYFRLR